MNGDESMGKSHALRVDRYAHAPALSGSSASCLRGAGAAMLEAGAALRFREAVEHVPAVLSADAP